MISRKNFWNLCDKYISEVITGPMGPSDLKYKGIFHWVREFPMLKYEPMIDPPKPISMSFALGRIEIVTRFLNGSHLYDTRIQFTYQGNKYEAAFDIPAEAWSRQALEYHFKEFCHKFEKDTSLIKLTPEEESQESYAEAKKKHFAAMYGAEQSTQYMAGLKEEIKALQESLKMNAKSQKWVVQGPNGNMHVASPDMGQQVLHNISAQADAAQSEEYMANNTMFNQVQKWAKEFYKLHGHFPEGPEEFFGMKIAFDPGVPMGMAQFHTTQPPLQQNPKTVQHYGNAGNELAKVIPALSVRGIGCPEPANCSYSPSAVMQMTLSQLIIHLNDSHLWPRSGTDPNPHNKPNIADWIDEICLIHGLDQSFHPQEEKPTVRDWAKIKKQKKEKKDKIQGASLSHATVDEPIVVDDEWLDKYQNKYFPGVNANWIPKGMFDGA